MLLSETSSTAGSKRWLSEDLVARMRHQVQTGMTPNSVGQRFLLLESLAQGDNDSASDLLPEAVRQAEPEVLQEPYWIRTFLSASLLLEQAEMVELVMTEGVGKCGKLSPDERILILGLVENNRSPNAKKGLASRD
jgi:hypothetical protein